MHLHITERGTVLNVLKYKSATLRDPPRIIALTLPARRCALAPAVDMDHIWRSAAGDRAAPNQLHLAAAVNRRDRQTAHARTDTVSLHRRSA